MRLFVFSFLMIICTYRAFSQKELFRKELNYKYYEIDDYQSNTQFQKIDTLTNLIRFLYDKKSNKDIFNWINFEEEKGHKLSIHFWDNSCKIKLIAEFVNYKANGMFIWFNKRGKIEIIAEYMDDRLVDIIYYRKEKFLNRFISVFGYNPPLTQRKSEGIDGL